MISTLLLGLALQGTPATEAPAPAPPAGEWRKVNAIQLIVNEEAVTTQDFFREVARKGTATTPAEREQQVVQVGTEIVSTLLKVQAGKDLGFDPVQIDRLVKDEMEATVERVGSVVELGARLEEADMDPQMLRDDTRSTIYRRLWEGSVIGRSAGPGGRAHVDRYVRPGKLLYEFRRRDPLELAPAMITLQQLTIPTRKVGGAGAALALAAALRERALGGEDFDLLVDEHGAAPEGTHGIGQPLELRRLQRSQLVQGTPELVEFLRAPSAGAISPPVPFRSEGELDAYVLFKIHALEIPEQPVFADRAIQASLRSEVESELQRVRRDRKLGELLSAAYVWPPEAFGRASAQPEAQATPAP